MGQRARDFITLLKREGNFIFWGRPGGVKGKELACQCRRHKRHVFHPWVGKSSLEEITDAGRDWGQEKKGTAEDEMA